MTALRLAMVPFSLYACGVGLVALFSPRSLVDVLGYAVGPSCYPWIQLVGCLVLPLGLGMLGALRDPVRNLALLQAMLVLAMFQLPMDVYLLGSGALSFGQIAVDLIVVSGTAVAIVALYPDRAQLIGLWQPASPARRLLRVGLVASFVYLLIGSTLSIFFPRLMNDMLRYSIESACIPWVQYGGPLDLAVGTAFLLAAPNPPRNQVIVTFVGIPLSASVVLLEAYLVWDGQLLVWQATDIPIAAFALATFVIAHPSRGRRDVRAAVVR